MSERRVVDGRGNGLFVVAVAVFVILALMRWPSFVHGINTDATAYVSIAYQYLAGGFERALNGYWGPLLSWLMVPPLAAGVEPLVAARMVQVAAGLGALFAVRWLARRLGATRRSIGVLGLCVTVPLAGYALLTVTPDILLVLLLVLYSGCVLPDGYRERRRYGFGAGAFGGLAYLAKSYALPFFLVHFVLINLLHLLRAGSVPADTGEGAGTGATARRRAVLRNFAGGLAVFALVAGPWVGALSHKYGRLTFGTAGQRAHALVGPEYWGDDPVFGTLIDPPSVDATSYWDDPTVAEMVTWRPWDSEDLMAHQMWLVWENFRALLRQTAAQAPFAIVAVLYLLGVALGGKRVAPGVARDGTGSDVPPGPDLEVHPALARSAAPLLWTIVVFAGGFLPIYVEMRYLWFAVVLSIVATVLVLQHFALTHRFRSAVWSFLASWLVLTCAAAPLNELLAHPDRGRETYELARTLSGDYGVHGNLASNDRWAPSLFTAFHMRARYFGQVPLDRRAVEADLVAALKQHAIDYYLVWDSGEHPGETPFPERRFAEVTGGKIKGLRVYAVSGAGQ